MKRRRVVLLGALAVWGLLGLGHALAPPHPRADLGRWKVVVLQSDDWGLEGWFPDLQAAAALAGMVPGLAPRLAPYRTSSLETAADVESLCTLLAARSDADGLPVVLQANTVVAAPAVFAAQDSATRWCAGGRPGREVRVEGFVLHQGGSAPGRYHRAGLAAAVDSAIARGVWVPQLHGLTHFDLPAYARALREHDPLAEQALAQGTLAYRGWAQQAELGSADPVRAQALARVSVELFICRFGRAPVSVIAPDYVWGHDDERAWRAAGLRVVQAKEEQFDPAHPPTSLRGRARKALARWWDARHFSLVYLRRPVRLEPYGNPDPAAPEGALAALRQVRAAWSRREPAIVAIHRVQLSNLEPAVAVAGRLQLARFLDVLIAHDGARFLVDEEVAQLWTTGVSAVRRGRCLVVRNYSGGLACAPGTLGAGAAIQPGTRVLPLPAAEENSRSVR
jgi:hypothetical protein